MQVLPHLSTLALTCAHPQPTLATFPLSPLSRRAAVSPDHPGPGGWAGTRRWQERWADPGASLGVGTVEKGFPGRRGLLILEGACSSVLQRIAGRT